MHHLCSLHSTDVVKTFIVKKLCSIVFMGMGSPCSGYYRTITTTSYTLLLREKLGPDESWEWESLGLSRLSLAMLILINCCSELRSSLAPRGDSALVQLAMLDHDAARDTSADWAEHR